MHADKPYFNQEDCRLIDTLGQDYRITIRNDSRLFPSDLIDYFDIDIKQNLSIPKSQHQSQHQLQSQSQHQLQSQPQLQSQSNTETVNKIFGIPKDDKIIVGTTQNPLMTHWDIRSDDVNDIVDDKKRHVNNKRARYIETDTESDTNTDTDTESDTESRSDNESDTGSDSENNKLKDKLPNEIKGVNYFESSAPVQHLIQPVIQSFNLSEPYDPTIQPNQNLNQNQNQNQNLTKKKTDILDSIRDELNSALDDE